MLASHLLGMSSMGLDMTHVQAILQGGMPHLFLDSSSQVIRASLDHRTQNTLPEVSFFKIGKKRPDTAGRLKRLKGRLESASPVFCFKDGQVLPDEAVQSLRPLWA